MSFEIIDGFDFINIIIGIFGVFGVFWLQKVTNGYPLPMANEGRHHQGLLSFAQLRSQTGPPLTGLCNNVSWVVTFQFAGFETSSNLLQNKNMATVYQN